MQNKSELLSEEEKNKNNVFMSKDLESLIQDYENPSQDFRNSTFNLILEFNNNELLKSEILKFKLKNNIFTFIFVNNINLSSDFLSNNIKKIFVEAEDVIIIDQEMLDCDVNYTIKLVDNNIYKYKIKVVRNKNGI